MRRRRGRSKLLEFINMRRTRVRLAPIDQALLDEAGKRFLERERPVPARDGDLLVQVLQGVPSNMLASTITHHEEFRRRDDAATDPRQ